MRAVTFPTSRVLLHVIHARQGDVAHAIDWVKGGSDSSDSSDGSIYRMKIEWLRRA